MLSSCLSIVTHFYSSLQRPFKQYHLLCWTICAAIVPRFWRSLYFCRASVATQDLKSILAPTGPSSRLREKMAVIAALLWFTHWIGKPSGFSLFSDPVAYVPLRENTFNILPEHLCPQQLQACFNMQAWNTQNRNILNQSTKNIQHSVHRGVRLVRVDYKLSRDPHKTSRLWFSWDIEIVFRPLTSEILSVRQTEDRHTCTRMHARTHTNESLSQLNLICSIDDTSLTVNSLRGAELFSLMHLSLSLSLQRND